MVFIWTLLLAKTDLYYYKLHQVQSSKTAQHRILLETAFDYFGYWLGNEDLEDELFQVGSAELIETVYKRKYDPNKGSFTSYIYPYLKYAMIRHVEQFITPVAIAHKDMLMISKCRKMHRDGMTDESIANEIGISKQLVARYLRFSFKTENIMLTLNDEYGEGYIENPKIISKEPRPDHAAYVKLCAEGLKLLFDKLLSKHNPNNRC